MTKRAWLVVLMVLWAATAAQAQNITSWTVNLYTGAEASAPLLRTATAPASAVTCNLDPASAQPNGSVRWSDPVNVGRDCQWVNATFFALAPGNYQGGLLATNSAGSSPESRSPFSVAVPAQPPAAPTGLRFKPSVP
jgi:hypothetical protein